MTQLTVTASSSLSWAGRFKALFTGKLFIKASIVVLQDNVRVQRSEIEVHVGKKPTIPHVGPGTSTEAGGMGIAE